MSLLEFLAEVSLELVGNRIGCGIVRSPCSQTRKKLSRYSLHRRSFRFPPDPSLRLVRFTDSRYGKRELRRVIAISVLRNDVLRAWTHQREMRISTLCRRRKKRNNKTRCVNVVIAMAPVTRDTLSPRIFTPLYNFLGGHLRFAQICQKRWE